jgi:hypothetical protein
VAPAEHTTTGSDAALEAELAGFAALARDTAPDNDGTDRTDGPEVTR